MIMAKTITKTENMIGRQSPLALINNAIHENLDETKIFYFEGQAGLGKTRLLEEVGKLQTVRQHGVRANFVWGGIIDLYHVRDRISLIYQLAENLEPTTGIKTGRQYFKSFRELYEQYQKQVMSATGTGILRYRKKLNDAFIANYNDLARQESKMVLTFDTLELLKYERDEIHEKYDIDRLDRSVLRWFLDNLPRLANTIVVLAGRPTEDLQENFAQSWRDKVKFCQVPPLTIDEVEAYVRTLIVDNKPLQKYLLRPDRLAQVNALAQGRPIYIGLVIDLLTSEQSDFSLSKLISATDVSNDDEVVQKELRTRLGNQFFSYFDRSHRQALLYLAHTQQGMDKDVLAYLLNITPRAAQILIDELAHYTFIKLKQRHNQPDQIFFHDELYDLFDEIVLRDRSDALDQYEKLRAYYQDRFDTLFDERSQLDTTRDIKRIRSLTIALQDVSLDLLHYQLQCNPKEGYQQYVKLTWDAIRGLNFEYDMHLRSILRRFLGRYFDSKKPTFRRWMSMRLNAQHVQRDGVVRWIRRYAERGDSEQSHKIIEGIEHDGQLLLPATLQEDILFRADYLSAKLHATPNNLDLIEKSIIGIIPKLLSLEIEEDSYDGWKKHMLLGYLHNYIGFAMRHHNRWIEATLWYSKSIGYYRAINAYVEMANAMNNSSFVLALLGAKVEALSMVNDALALRTRFAEDYPRILSLNTKASILLANGLPERAEAFCMQAKNELTQLGLENTPAEGFIYITLAKIEIELAQLYFDGSKSFQESHDYLDFANGHLRVAKNLLSQYKTYAFQAALLLGRLYRTRVRLYKQKRLQKANIDEWLELAEHHYNQALALAKKLGMADEIANVYQDLGELYEVIEDTSTAIKYIDLAEKEIPQLYRPQVGQGFAKIESPINNYWLIQGDIYLTKARISEKSGVDFTEFPELSPHSETELLLRRTRYHVLAAACYEMWSPFPTSTRDLDKMRTQLYDQLKESGMERLKKIPQDIRGLFDEYRLPAKFEGIFEFVDATLTGLGVLVDMHTIES